jgi:hypothetical protein
MDSTAAGDPAGVTTTNVLGSSSAFNGTGSNTIAAGTATAGATSNWYFDGLGASVSGGSLAKVATAATAVQTSTQTPVASSTTVSGASGDVFTPAYGAYIASNQASGTYNNTVLYTVVTNM